MRPLIVLLICGFLSCCSSKIANIDSSKCDNLRILVKKVGFQSLPYKHDLSKDSDFYKYRINPKSNDTLFFSEGNGLLIGVLPDTTSYFGILYYKIGDALCPSLRTFDKNGKLISDRSISFGICAGCDCECDSCSDSITITKDLDIKMFNYLKSTKCDSLGKKIPGTTNCKVITIEGLVDKTGEIKMKEKVERIINK
jgi:hypothetical protein